MRLITISSTRRKLSLLPQIQDIYHRPAVGRTAAEKDLIRLDEQINIVYQLINHTMPASFRTRMIRPTPGTHLAMISPIFSLRTHYSLLTFLTDICRKYNRHCNTETGAKPMSDWMRLPAFRYRTTKLHSFTPGRLRQKCAIIR